MLTSGEAGLKMMGVTNTSAYTHNQLIFNEYLLERWAAIWTRALFAPAHAAFPFEHP